MGESAAAPGVAAVASGAVEWAAGDARARSRVRPAAATATAAAVVAAAAAAAVICAQAPAGLGGVGAALVSVAGCRMRMPRTMPALLTAAALAEEEQGHPLNRHCSPESPAHLPTPPPPAAIPAQRADAPPRCCLSPPSAPPPPQTLLQAVLPPCPSPSSRMSCFASPHPQATPLAVLLRTPLGDGQNGPRMHTQ
eukprot:1161499-Pelagomonas_calceolata.AAC.1